ncbi:MULTISPECIES: hypothetical protein [Nitrosomonas]|uniref:hypothetical protein n=1 Tax=Nitrosomonas TaxID=914 RepID=UPI00130E2E3E|nr:MULTISPECIES: hypothetical protein [Nitrosomonas]UVS60495.1 hypothetical protein NX761_13395 [Nitrosomonas sp. PLL12]
MEIHHLAGRKHASNTVPVCLNCHAMLTRRQCDEWPDFWRGERCAAFLLLGFLDYCVLASNPAIPLELFSEQCEEMKVAAVDKAAAALVFLIKIILPVILLALIINVLMQSASKPKG